MHSITMHEGAGPADGYRVEVSGWDANESFFVEKSTLLWTESLGKRLALKALVRIGSVLFVRLIKPLGGGNGLPVAYRAVEYGAANRGTQGMVTVEQLQPRLAFVETSARFAGHEPRLA
ncbi:MAG TPA: hypothetical protein VGD60_00885 [Candidatus Acidoferrales bacterium]